MKRPTLLLLMLTGVGCAGHAHERGAPRQAPPIVDVRVEKALEVLAPIGDEVVGTVRARSVAVVSASVMGAITYLRVSLGSQVRAGDVIVRLSAGEIEAKTLQARASLAQLKLDLDRDERLIANRSIPQAQYDATLAQYRVAEAILAETEAMHGYTTIRAPVSGVVTDKPADVGDLAMPGKPLLTIESSNALQLEASVSEAVAHRLSLGQTLPVHIDAAGGELIATVRERGPSADPESRTVLVKLELPPSAELRAGMFGRLLIETGEARELTLPKRALVKRGQMETVFVVGPRDTVQLRLVRTGRAHADRVEVLSGLDAGEAVVVADATQLVDGQRVRVLP